jgi:hypothetical protein
MHSPPNKIQGDSSAREEAARLAKAEKWLAEQVNTSQANASYGVPDPEALIYLISRQRECDDAVRKLIASWKTAEGTRLEEFNSRRRGANPISIEGVTTVSPLRLPDFWEAGPLGEYSTEATMLRAVDWCAIPGFEPWWRRLVRTHREALLSGGLPDRRKSAFWLFNMARSDYALNLMPEVLAMHLRAISLETSDRDPWVFETDSARNIDIAYASALVFSHYRLNPAESASAQVHHAVDAICRYQDESSGPWPDLTLDSGRSKGSVESTAMALHALALARPAGWPRISQDARLWLWSVQKASGFWRERGTPGDAFLSVLV